MEDPNAHITKFLRICSTFKMNGVPNEAIKLRLFPFSLRDKADSWLISFPANHFASWDQLHREFLKRFYPLSKTQRMRRAIQNFKQISNESLAESWERFKELQRQCPHHGIQGWDLMMAFYEGLLDNSKILVDASSGGSFTVLEPTQAEELLEKIATNGTTWYSERSSQRLVGGFHDVDQISALSAKVDNMASMVQKIAQITLNNQNVSYASSTSIPPRQIMMCDLCGGEHNLGECLNDDMGSQSTMEQVDLVGYGRQQQSFQPQGAYNPNASRNHPGFSWSNPMGAANPQSFGNRGPPPGFQGQQNYRGGQQQQQSRQNLGFQNSNAQPRQPLEKPPPPNWEAMIEMMFKSQMQSEEKIRQVSDKLDQLSAHHKMLENQIANQASTSSTKVTGKLPACPENPREHMNAIITRSGKQLEVENGKLKEDVVVQSKGKDSCLFKSEEDEIQKLEPLLRQIPPLPFPQKFKKAKVEERRARFLSLIKQLDISIPLLDAITEIPSYARFLKEILSNKRRFEDRETVAVNEECSALIQNKLPPKLRDPGSFSIPCVIGGSLVQRALCDLGASVSLMPYSLCKKLQLGEPKPTAITLQLADRSVKHPVGVLEDVPVKIDKYYIPGDFVVLEMEEDAKVPIILGRPFLATSGAVIDVKKGTLVLEIGDDKVEFNVFELASKSPCLDECFCVDTIDSCVRETLEESNWISNDPLGVDVDDTIEEEQIDEDTSGFDELFDENELLVQPSSPKLEVFGLGDQLANHNGDNHPKVELKPLPSELKYAFLGSNSTYPVIVNANLNDDEIEKLLHVLKRHKKIIGYTLDDIVGISASYCMHRIYLEEGYKPSIEPQRRLNPIACV
ncbi:uncharacterized protein LOC116001355 [Ipomoea triloba]|uniref:uncharacterized protein LOC116001355 n=1 Tax=Ipomoea triloba TaxID=35885 RepID=UPI00125DD6D7|nr:uncharacterized protein LOC116001355 [Ipomoea triloba]